MRALLLGEKRIVTEAAFGCGPSGLLQKPNLIKGLKPGLLSWVTLSSRSSSGERSARLLLGGRRGKGRDREERGGRESRGVQVDVVVYVGKLI